MNPAPQKSLARVLVAHNFYRHRGGEDAVAEAEMGLLQQHGHPTELYSRHNDELHETGEVHAALDTVWSRRTTREIERLIDGFEPDVIHVHNTFPLISPSVYWAASHARVPVVQTLHNFRLLCPQAMLLRDDKICEACVGRVPWRGALWRCYRQSMAQSTVVASMLTAHRLLGTWSTKVTRYIVLNEFCRKIFVSSGMPAEKLVVKPNFVSWLEPAEGCETESDRASFLFVGRLSAEKGIATLASAFRAAPELELRVAGTGSARELIEGIKGVNLLGGLTLERVRQEMACALALVVPSVWYENFPRTLVEAFACGLPVIASRLGALADLVRDRETGLLFEPGNTSDLITKLRWALAHPSSMREMGMKARREYEAKYTPGINYGQLVSIYDSAIQEAARHGQ